MTSPAPTRNAARALSLQDEIGTLEALSVISRDPGAPPVRIVARREGVLELRVFVQEWHSLAVEETAQ